MAATAFLDSAAHVDLLEQISNYKRNRHDCYNTHRKFINSDGYLFADPENEIERFLPFLEQYTLTVEMTSNYFDYRPDYLSSALYGTHDLWYLIMRINNCRNRSMFRGPKFTVIDPNAINDIRNFLAICVDSVEKSQVINQGDLTIKEINIY